MMRQVEKSEVVMWLNSPILPFLYTLFQYFLQHPFPTLVIFMKYLPLVHALFSSLKCIISIYVDYDIIRTVVRIVGMGRMSHIYAIQNVHVYKVALKST